MVRVFPWIDLLQPRERLREVLSVRSNQKLEKGIKWPVIIRSVGETSMSLLVYLAALMSANVREPNLSRLALPLSGRWENAFHEQPVSRGPRKIFTKRTNAALRRQIYRANCSISPFHRSRPIVIRKRSFRRADNFFRKALKRFHARNVWESRKVWRQ